MENIINTRTRYLILVLLLLLLGCTPPKIKRKLSAKPLRFDVAEIRAEAKESVKTRRKAQLASLLDQQSSEVVAILTRFSTTAFLEPRALRSKKATRLEKFFASELKGEVEKGWQALSLGEESSLVSRVAKNEGKISRLWIYYDDNLIPVIAAVDFGLQAEYELGDGNKATLGNSSSFILQPDGSGSWEISGYQIRLELRSREKKRVWKAYGRKLN